MALANFAFLKDALPTFYELELGRKSLLDAIGIHQVNPLPSPEADPLANHQ